MEKTGFPAQFDQSAAPIRENLLESISEGFEQVRTPHLTPESGHKDKMQPQARCTSFRYGRMSELDCSPCNELSRRLTLAG